MQGVNPKKASTARLLGYVCLECSQSSKVYSVIVQGQPSELQEAIAKQTPSPKPNAEWYGPISVPPLCVPV